MTDQNSMLLETWSDLPLRRYRPRSLLRHAEHLIATVTRPRSSSRSASRTNGWRNCWWFRFLETADESFAYSGDEPPPQGRWSVSGAELQADLLRKIYEGNARRVIPTLRE
jgi:hypothetical protein